MNNGRGSTSMNYIRVLIADPGPLLGFIPLIRPDPICLFLTGPLSNARTDLCQEFDKIQTKVDVNLLFWRWAVGDIRERG